MNEKGRAGAAGGGAGEAMGNVEYAEGLGKARGEGINGRAGNVVVDEPGEEGSKSNLQISSSAASGGEYEVVNGPG